MKRLLIAVSAVACAFGLRAAETWASGTSFEGATGALSDNLTVGELETLEAGSSYWAIPDNDDNQELTIKSYEAAGIDAPTEAQRGVKQQGVWEDDLNFLSIRTSFGKPLTRNLELDGAGKTIGANGIYIDSQVKFTACDEIPTLTDEKLVIYVLEDENGGQKLHVNAGYISATGAIERKDYECGDWGYADGWVRLTVKTIDNILSESGKHCPGFVVFINSTNAGSDPIACSETKCLLPMTDNAGAFDKALFPAYVANLGDDNDELVSIGFDGQGALNDLVINDEPPFNSAKDNVFFTLVKGENVTGFTYQVGSETPVPVTDTTKVKYVAGGVITISDVTVTDGYMPAALTPISMTEGGSATISAVKVAAVATIDGVPTSYATVAEAIAAINDAGEVTKAELKFAGDYAEGVVIDNSDIAELVIDLAGAQISSSDEENATITCGASKLTITNSTVAVGKVCATVGGSVAAEGDLTIYDGLYEGTVAAGYDFIVNGGKFKEVPTGATLPEGMTWTTEPDVDGYYTLIDKPVEKHGWAIYLAEGGENEFLISSEADLIALATWANKTDEDGETFPTKDITFTQTADITLTAPFAGIGVPQSATDNFQGIYDGNGKTVSNYVMKSRTDGNNYRGLFNTTMGATIKNLTVNCAGFEDGISGEKGTAGIVGDARTGTLVQGCTVAGTISGGTHNVAGIAIRVTDSTLLNCTNNAAITGGYTKIAGIAALTKSSTSKALLEGCVNNGTITANDGKTAGRDGLAGIIAYTEDEKLYIKDCVNTGALVVGSSADPNPKVGQILGYSYKKTVFQGANKGTTDKLLVNGLTVNNGFNFAMVDGSVATLIADTAVAAGGSYLVAAPVSTKAVTLALGETIAFDNKLYNSFAANVTTSAGAGYKVNSDVQGTVTTYSVGAITYNITFTSQDGTTAPAAMTYTVNSTFPLALADATTALTGIEFKGWTNATYTTAIKAIAALPATLGDIALVAQWDAVVAPEDWDNPKTPITPGTKAEDAWPSLKDTPLAQADASKLVTWAKDTTKGNITFDKAAEIKVEAFLLDCANTEEAVAAEKKAFKVTSITQDENGDWVATVGDAGDGEAYKNGFINIVPYDLEGAGDDAEFFQAKLLLQPVTKE